MFRKITTNIFQYFLLKAAVFYTVFYLTYEFILKRYTTLDQVFIRKLITLCIIILEGLNYKTFASKDINDFQVFGIDGSGGVWIGSACNGITLIFLFAVFVVAYPGKLITKLWFIPTGVLLIFIINIIRIIALTLIANSYPQHLDFNHTYTFTFIAYSVVFGLWMLWVNKFSSMNHEKNI